MLFVNSILERIRQSPPLDRQSKIFWKKIKINVGPFHCESLIAFQQQHSFHVQLGQSLGDLLSLHSFGVQP